MSSDQAGSAPMLGDVEPRLCTPPLREITPESSAGFRAVAWMNANLNVTLLPHQEFIFQRGLELNPDGSCRFRVVLIMAGRQGGGKTTTAMSLALWRLLDTDARLVLATSAQLDNAREFFLRSVDMVAESPTVEAELRSVRRANGQEAMTMRSGARLKILATNDRAARGYSADLVLCDELRTHESFAAWAALSPTILARPNGQIWCFSNAGTDASVVLNSLRASALSGADPSVCLLEWSAPPGSDLDDERGWRAAQPALGRTVPADAIRSALATTPPNLFRCEYLCETVVTLDSLFDMGAWAECADAAGTLESSKQRVCAAIDVAPDLRHVTLAVSAALPDGRVRVEIVAAWDSVTEARAALPGWLSRVRPRKLGYGPGPAAASLAVDLRAVKVARALTVAEVVEACGGFVEQVASRRVLHTNDPLATAHVAAAVRLPVGDGFRFTRTGGHVDAVYAMACAVWLARSVPPPPRLRLVTAPTDKNDDEFLGHAHPA